MPGTRPPVFVPAGLAEVIALHREMFGGWTMTATAPEGGAPAAPAASAEPPATPGQPPASAAPQQPAQPPVGETPEQTISRLTAELTSARQEAGKSRVNAKQAAADEARNSLVQELGRALGLIKTEGEQVDPAKLTAQLTEQQAAATGAQVQLAVFKAAAKHGADPEALLDSNTFLRSLDGLAPADADKIDAAIKAAVETNPKLKTAPAAGRSGAEFAGGTGEQRKQPASLDAAVRAAYGA